MDCLDSYSEERTFFTRWIQMEKWDLGQKYPKIWLFKHLKNMMHSNNRDDQLIQIYKKNGNNLI